MTATAAAQSSTSGWRFRRSCDAFEAVIQHATGRPVIGFMSGNQQDPDMICEVFVLSPTDLVEEQEIRAAVEARATD